MLLPLALVVLASPGSDPLVRHVIHVSVDGLRGDLVRAVLESPDGRELVALRRFVAEGATTFNARSDASHTNTLPNHASIFTGRPVLRPTGWAGSAHHGLVRNSLSSTDLVLHGSNPSLAYVASVFDVAHDHGLSTALYASKHKFIVFDRSWNADAGAPDAVGADDGRDKIDEYCVKFTLSPLGGSALNLHHEFVGRMREARFRYAFVHYLDTDSTGHFIGWGSRAWESALATVDRYLVDLIELVESEPALAGATAIVLTSDHGGRGESHSDLDDVANHTIPVLVWGPGVAAGADLYALNRATRADPGNRVVGYEAPVQPIRNGDTGNLCLMLLGLPAIPGSVVNAAQDLRVTLRPDELPIPLARPERDER